MMENLTSIKKVILIHDSATYLTQYFLNKSMMKLLRKKYSFFFFTICLSVIILVIEYYILSITFKPYIQKGIEYDLLNYTRLFLISVHYALLFSFSLYILVLALFLIYKDNIENNLVRNIYFSIVYIVILIGLIEYFF